MLTRIYVHNVPIVYVLLRELCHYFIILSIADGPVEWAELFTIALGFDKRVLYCTGIFKPRLGHIEVATSDEILACCKDSEGGVVYEERVGIWFNAHVHAYQLTLPVTNSKPKIQSIIVYLRQRVIELILNIINTRVRE